MAEEKKGTKKTLVAKPIDINSVKSLLSGEIKKIKEEKEANDPNNILKKLQGEITEMIAAGLTVSQQHALLKKHGVDIKIAIYKEYIKELSSI